jgi:hypothetical protein
MSYNDALYRAIMDKSVDRRLRLMTVERLSDYGPEHRERMVARTKSKPEFLGLVPDMTGVPVKPGEYKAMLGHFPGKRAT